MADRTLPAAPLEKPWPVASWSPAPLRPVAAAFLSDEPPLPREPERPATLADLIVAAARTLIVTKARRLAAPLIERPKGRVPSRVRVAPETLSEADPQVATDIYAGVFAFAGEVVDTDGRSPFVVPAPSLAWAEALHAFDWLVHLEASASQLSSTNACALFDEWQTSRRSHHAAADRPKIVARRLTAWLVQAPLLLNDADPAFRQRYMRQIARHMRRLQRFLAYLPHGPERLEVATALTLAGVALDGEGAALRRGLSHLEATLAVQILADGGHRSRSPAELLRAVRQLVVLREAMGRAQVPLPVRIARTLDTMVPMLRFFTLCDGALARVHGVPSPEGPDDARAALAYDDVEGQPLKHARHSGYHRIRAGKATVLFDVGGEPAPAFAADAAASALAFEFCHAATRLITHCGSLGSVRAEWADAGRATAAHSTLTVADTSSARVLSVAPLAALLGPVLYDGPPEVSSARSGNEVSASHAGYVRGFGLTHSRTLRLRSDGLALSGEDALVGRDGLAAHSFAIRFHVHPSVRATVDGKRRQAALTLPDGSIWVLRIDEGPQLALEESVVAVAPRTARRARQVVVAGDTLTDPRVRWHIARHGAPLRDPGARDAARAPDHTQTDEEPVDPS